MHAWRAPMNVVLLLALAWAPPMEGKPMDFVPAVPKGGTPPHIAALIEHSNREREAKFGGKVRKIQKLTQQMTSGGKGSLNSELRRPEHNERSNRWQFPNQKEKEA